MRHHVRGRHITVPRRLRIECGHEPSEGEGEALLLLRLRARRFLRGERGRPTREDGHQARPQERVPQHFCPLRRRLVCHSRPCRDDACTTTCLSSPPKRRLHGRPRNRDPGAPTRAPAHRRFPENRTQDRLYTSKKVPITPRDSAFSKSAVRCILRVYHSAFTTRDQTLAPHELSKLTSARSVPSGVAVEARV